MQSSFVRYKGYYSSSIEKIDTKDIDTWKQFCFSFSKLKIYFLKFIFQLGSHLGIKGIIAGHHDSECLLIDSMRLRRLVTLRTAVGILMTVPLRMPGGVH